MSRPQRAVSWTRRLFAACFARTAVLSIAGVELRPPPAPFSAGPEVDRAVLAKRRFRGELRRHAPRPSP